MPALLLIASTLLFAVFALDLSGFQILLAHTLMVKVSLHKDWKRERG